MRNIELLQRSPFWAIRPDAVPALLMATSQELTQEAANAAAPSTFRGPTGNKIAVIPVQGTLYGYKYNAISSAVEAAASNPDVKRIVLSVDSPGGEVTGLPETAAVIANAAKSKPVHAIVEGSSASAAYWLTSQATDITLTPSGEVGSVGVRMLHADMSKALENDGVKVTELQAGQYKTEWSPYKPLSEEAAANMQTRLDAMHTEFLSAIASGRGTRASSEIAGQRFGEGRMFSASDAVAHGLVDKVQSSRDFYRSITPAAEEAPTFPIRARLELERARY